MTHATPVTASARPVRLALAAMGTRFEIALHGEDRVRLRAAGEAALAEIADCHRRFTRFSADSLVSRIRRVAADRPVPLDADTFALFEDALAVGRLSGGAFDVTVAPLMDGEPGARTAGGAIELDRPTMSLRLRAPGLRLDLGAIAKGHALDLAARVLRESCVASALLHGGTSSVVAIGAPPGAGAWRIGLAQAPLRGPIDLRDEALAVSTTRGGHAPGAAGPAGHIMDPRTGRPAAAAGGVAVTGPSARLADAWATALVVLGHRPAGLGPEWHVRFFDLDTA